MSARANRNSRRASLDLCVRPKEQVAFQAVAEEMVLLDFDAELYYGLNATGALIWSQLAETPRLKDVRDALVQRLDAPPERIEADLLSLIDALLEAGLVEPLDGPVD